MNHDLCGTYAGYQVHRKNQEQACDNCQMALRLYGRMWRLRHGGAMWRCKECGSVFDAHRCTVNDSEILRAE